MAETDYNFYDNCVRNTLSLKQRETIVPNKRTLHIVTVNNTPAAN